MVGAALVWDLIAKDGASAVFMRVSSAADRAATSTAAASTRINRAGASMAAVGTSLTKKFTLPIVAIGAVSVKAATDFNASMTKISTQAGGSAKDVQLLSKQVLDLAKTTQQGPEQLANSLYHLKSVGLDNVGAMKALKQASDLAAVGNTSVEETTNALAGAWRTGIRGATDFHQAVRTLNAVIGAGNMSMDDLNAALGTGILPTAKTFGLTLKDVGSALAVFTDEGVPADAAATRLRMSMSLLGAPSKAAEKQLNQINLTGNKLGNDMRKPNGLINAIGDLKTHLEDPKFHLSLTQQAALLSHAFGGGRSSSAILSLINNFDVLKRKQDQVTNSMGKYDQAVAQQSRTPQAQFKLLESSMERAAIMLGDALLPGVIKVTNKIADLVEEFNGLSSGTKKMILFGALGVAALGPLLTILGRLTQAFGLVVRAAEFVWAGGAKLVGFFASTGAAASASAATQTAAAVEVSEAEIAKANATAEAAVNIAASLEGTDSILAAEATAAAESAIEFAAAMQSQADAAAAAAAEIGTAAAAVVTSEEEIGTVASGAALGPLGLAIGAVAGGALVAASHFGLFGKSAADQVASVDSLTAAIKADSGALGENARATVVNSLQKTGALDDARKLGLNLADVTTAAIKGGPALAALSRQLNIYSIGSYGAAKGNSAQIRAARDLQEILGATNNQVGKATQAYRNEKSANDAAAKATDKHTEAVKGQGKSLGNLSGAMSRIQSQIDKYANTKAIPKLDANPTSATQKIRNLQLQMNAIKQGRVPQLTANSTNGKLAVQLLQIRINNLKQQAVPKVNVNTGTSSAKLSALQSQLNAMRDKTVFVNVYTKQLHGGRGVARASGGYVSGPGTSTSDSIPARLSNGEFVVRASQTAKHLSLLNAINSGAQGFAKGGRVGGHDEDGIDKLMASYRHLFDGALGLLKHVNAGHRGGGHPASHAWAATPAQVAKAAHDAATSVAAAVAAAVKPALNSVHGLSGAYRGDRNSAVAAGKTANIAQDKYLALQKTADRLTRSLTNVRLADKKAVDAARAHATALSNQAHEAERAAQKLPSATKAQKAEKKAAEEHAKDLADRARKASQAATKLSRDDSLATSKLLKNVDAAKKAAQSAKDSYSKLASAAKDAASRAADAAQALVSHLNDNFTALLDKVNDFKSTISGGLLQGTDLSSVLSAAGTASSLTAAQNAVAQAAAGYQAASAALTAAQQAVNGGHGTAAQYAALTAAQQRQTDAITALTSANDDLATAQSNVASATSTTQTSVADLQAQFNSVLKATQSFSTDLNKLVAEGANQDLISQIAGMGATQGDALAQSLLAAGPAGIAALQKTMGSIASVAGNETDALAGNFYSAGETAMLNLVKGLEAQYPALKAALDPIIAQINALLTGQATAGTKVGSNRTITTVYNNTLGQIAKNYGVKLTDIDALNSQYSHATAATQVAKGTKIIIPALASGIGSWPGGAAVVGEFGPEMVSLPRGARVTDTAGTGSAFNAMATELQLIRAELKEIKANTGDTAQNTADAPGLMADGVLTAIGASNARKAAQQMRDARTGRNRVSNS